MSMYFLELSSWQQMLFGDAGSGFLIETVLRTFIMYLVILAALRVMGKRGVKQLSIFELVVIIGLGSAAGDPMFYKEVGILTAVFVFAVIIAAYKLTTFFISKSQKFEELVEGKTICLIEDGRFCYGSFDKEDLAQDEFFAELRVKGVSQLGQVERGYLESSGELSLFYYEDEAIKKGLPILLHEYKVQHTLIPEKGDYACAFCGEVRSFQPASQHQCSTCKKNKWVKAVLRKRIS